jgi:ribonuclease HI
MTFTEASDAIAQAGPDAAFWIQGRDVVASKAPTKAVLNPRPSTTPVSIDPNAPITAWSDGACAGNPGPGGWGAVVFIDGDEIVLDGGDVATTNNRMEMLAAIAAIEAAPNGRRLILTVDSEYVKNGATQWLQGWKRRGWKTASGGPVKNPDLWVRMDAALTAHGNVEWLWCRGHSGTPENERVDQIAVAAKKRFGEKLRGGGETA